MKQQSAPATQRCARRQRSSPLTRGMALIEALVASAVLGMGLAGATRLTLYALQTASETRQHTVAQTLAVNAMECHQSGQPRCEVTEVLTVQGTTYTLKSQLHPRADGALVDIEVSVQWPTLGRAQAAGTSGPRIGQLVLHSSRDPVPAWVGVSSP